MLPLANKGISAEHQLKPTIDMLHYIQQNIIKVEKYNSIWTGGFFFCPPEKAHMWMRNEPVTVH